MIQGKFSGAHLPRSVSANLSISPYLSTAHTELARGRDLPQPRGRRSSIPAPPPGPLPLPRTSCWSLCSTSSWWRALIPTRSRLHRFRSMAMKGSFPLSVERQAQGEEGRPRVSERGHRPGQDIQRPPRKFRMEAVGY